MKKFSKVTDAIKAIVAASAVLVGSVSAHEKFNAPHWTYHSQGYSAKVGCVDDCKRMQKRIALLRSYRSDTATTRADRLHAHMLANYMELKWTDVTVNTVTTVGKNDLLDKYFAGSAYTATWFCGVISSVSYTAIAAGDTMASHSGWTEAGGTNAPTYTGNRPALAFAAASGGSKATSSASSFTFTGAGTIKGMFGNTITTKDGTTGVLYNAVLFTGGDRVVVNTDVVNVSVTYTA